MGQQQEVNEMIIGQTLMTVNLVVQIVLIITVFGAVYLARGKKLTKHCTVIRVAVPIQIVAILVIMLPSMLGFIENVHLYHFSIPRYSYITHLGSWLSGRGSLSILTSRDE